MLMLSVDGWLNGLTAVGIFVVGWVMGIYFIYQSRKTKAKLLKYLGLTFIFAVNAYWGVCLDFLTILLSDTIPYPTYPTPLSLESLRLSLVFMWGGFTPLALVYIGAELLIPEKKWHILLIIFFFSIGYELLIFFDTENSIINLYPTIPGEDLWLASLALDQPAGIIASIQIVSAVIINETAILNKAKMSIGVIRKKYILMSVGFFFTVTMIMVEGIISMITILIFTRIIMIISFWIIYLGLREEPEKPQETIKKKIKVEGDLFRLIQNRPKDITEEEVIYHKEQEICLVCKGSTSRLTYICPDCKALYCIKCSEALSDLENACWGCNTPIDPSKPSKPYEKEEDGPNLEILEKDKKSESALK